MARLDIPTFETVPTGLLPLQETLLRDVSMLDTIRAAKACRAGANRARGQLSAGGLSPSDAAITEATIVSLQRMEDVLTALCGALRAAEREAVPTEQEAAHAA